MDRLYGRFLLPEPSDTVFISGAMGLACKLVAGTRIQVKSDVMFPEIASGNSFPQILILTFKI